MSTQWCYSKHGQQQGPVSSEQLKRLAASGQLQPSDLVWQQGMGQRVEARKVKGLFLVKAKPVPAPIPSLPDDLAWIEDASQSSTTHSPAVAPTPGSTKAEVAAARRKSNATQIGKIIGYVAAVVIGIKLLSTFNSFFSNDQHSPPQVPSSNFNRADNDEHEERIQRIYDKLEEVGGLTPEAARQVRQAADIARKLDEEDRRKPYRQPGY